MQKSLNELIDTDYEEIKRLAGLFFVPAEIAIMLEMDGQSFCEECYNIGCDIFNAYQGGRLQGEIDVRTGIIKMAKAGSSPAQTMALELLKHSKITLMEHGQRT